MIHTIETNNLVVEVSEKGAELQSIRSKKDGTEYLWQGTHPYWPGRAPILFPIVCSIKNSRYTYAGTTYEMPQHGFARHSIFELAERTPYSLKFELTSSAATKKSYPFDFKLLVEYILNGDSLAINYKVENKGNSAMLFNIGAHEAYNCPVFKDETFEDYYLEFEPLDGKLTATSITEKGLLTNSHYEIEAENNCLNLDYELIRKNGTLIFENINSKKITIKSNKSDTCIEVAYDAPHVGVWTQHENGRPPFVCIEPWHGLPDEDTSTGVLEDKKGILRLEAGAAQLFSHTITVH